jgi:hypothetical protein
MSKEETGKDNQTFYKTVWIKMFIPKPTNAPIAIPIIVIITCSPNHMIGTYHEFRLPIIACVIFLPKNPINIAYIIMLIISMPLIGKSLTSSDVIKDISPIVKKTNVNPTVMLHISGWNSECRTDTAYLGSGRVQYKLRDKKACVR